MHHFKKNSDPITRYQSEIIFDAIVDIESENKGSDLDLEGLKFDSETMSSTCGRYQVLYFGIYDYMESPYNALYSETNDGFKTYVISKMCIERRILGGTYVTYLMVIRQKVQTEKGDENV